MKTRQARRGRLRCGCMGRQQEKKPTWRAWLDRGDGDSMTTLNTAGAAMEYPPLADPIPN